jgi:fucose permease
LSKTVRPQLLFVGSCAGILVFGIVLAILGTVLGMPEMRARLHADLAQQGNLFLLLYFGIFCASLVVGPLIDHVGNKANLIGSSALVAAAMVWFAATHSLAGASAAALLLGLGGGGLNTCTNALVSDLYGDRRGPMLNLLGIFFGIGAAFVPLLAASLEGHFAVSQLFLFCAVLAGACFLAYAIMSFPPAAAARAFSWHGALGVLKYPGLLLLAFVLFFESGNEACIGGWTSIYANASGFSQRMATLTLAGYWCALMLSRLLAARLLRIVGKIELVLAGAVISLAGCGILLSARSLPLLFVGVAFIGLSYGPIFPTALAIAGDRYPNVAGTVFGLLFSVAMIGGMSFPWAAGHISQQFSLRTGMMAPLLGAVGVSVLSAVLMLRERRAAAISGTGAAGL